MEEDGRPVVKCLVCGAIYKHGGLYGPTVMAGHLSQPGHVKEGRILVYGNAFDSPILISKKVKKLVLPSGALWTTVDHCGPP